MNRSNPLERIASISRDYLISTISTKIMEKEKQGDETKAYNKTTQPPHKGPQPNPQFPQPQPAALEPQHLQQQVHRLGSTDPWSRADQSAIFFPRIQTSLRKLVTHILFMLLECGWNCSSIFQDGASSSRAQALFFNLDLLMQFEPLSPFRISFPAQLRRVGRPNSIQHCTSDFTLNQSSAHQMKKICQWHRGQEQIVSVFWWLSPWTKYVQVSFSSPCACIACGNDNMTFYRRANVCGVALLSENENDQIWVMNWSSHVWSSNFFIKCGSSACSEALHTKVVSRRPVTHVTVLCQSLIWQPWRYCRFLRWPSVMVVVCTCLAEFSCTCAIHGGVTLSPNWDTLGLCIYSICIHIFT